MLHITLKVCTSSTKCQYTKWLGMKNFFLQLMDQPKLDRFRRPWYCQKLLIFNYANSIAQFYQVELSFTSPLSLLEKVIVLCNALPPTLFLWYLTYCSYIPIFSLFLDSLFCRLDRNSTVLCVKVLVTPWILIRIIPNLIMVLGFRPPIGVTNFSQIEACIREL